MADKRTWNDRQKHTNGVEFGDDNSGLREDSAAETEEPFEMEPRTRITWQSGVKGYLRGSRETEKLKVTLEAAREDRKLTLGEDHLALEAKVLVLEERKEQRLASEQDARNDQAAAMAKAVASMMAFIQSK